MIRCERLYYLLRVAPQARSQSADPLVRGSIGHTGLAHEYARRAAVRAGLDPEAYYTRDEGMALVAAQFGEVGERLLPIAQAAVNAYFDHYDSKKENLEVVAIEAPVAAELTTGKRITQRLDLVIRDTNGRVWLYDHKFSSIDPTAQKTVDRYTLSGQFLLMQLFGQSLYGSLYGGVRVNMIGCLDGNSRFTFRRFSPEPAPAALASFPRMVAARRERMAQLAAVGDPEAYLPAFSEQICVTAYGRCPMFSQCQWEWGLAK
jgi:hypothetical protein